MLLRMAKLLLCRVQLLVWLALVFVGFIFAVGVVVMRAMGIVVAVIVVVVLRGTLLLFLLLLTLMVLLLLLLLLL